MSKITKGIQDKETFTRTKCTSTVVIYKYSSPSSFQLSENKKSKCKEQLKDPITQLFWRADTIECPRCRCVTLSTLFTRLYIHAGAICSLRFTLQRSKMRLRLLTWPLTMGDTHMHTLSHAYTHRYACM